MNCLVLVNKPVGVRSTQCVGAVRKYFDGAKAGHAGTLDSTASGLLVVLVGHATRLCEYVMNLPKVYRAVIQFGSETDTCDYSGEVISSVGWENLSVEMVADFLKCFSGWRMQTPPAISAVKVNGQASYKLARSGQVPELKTRPVFFRRITQITPYSPETGRLELEISCSRGTYIRSLAQDIGRLTGCGAHIAWLERISVGNFRVKDASGLDSEDIKPISLTELAHNFTRIDVGPADERSFTNGMSILLSHALKIHRGVSLMNGDLCVEGEEFIGFGRYAGYDYVRPEVIVPKC
ncbi:MAG: tRNA pseudouridine(55) synthase TruB [Synergistaceae bacterium]|nr:tRNA pseudouridine(55) synthase TruB [Synergistaceae bacterium]